MRFPLSPCGRVFCVGALLVLATGCGAWRMPKLDVNRFRDPRAVDIDDRLSSTPKPVQVTN